MYKLGIYTSLPRSIPKTYHPFCACLIYNSPQIIRHPNFSTKQLDPGTHFHLDFDFSNKISFKKITYDLTIADSTTSQVFGYPKRLKHTPPYLIKNFINFPTTMYTSDPYSVLMKVVSLPNRKIPSNSVLTMRSLSKPLVAMLHQSTGE